MDDQPRIVPAVKIRALARRLPAASRPADRLIQKATIEASGLVVEIRQGDWLVHTITAPSGPAARVIAQTLRDLQTKRGHVF